MKMATFTQLSGCERRSFTLKGRDAWALERLIAAGPKGCTPINQPAPRWSAYIHNLRKMGLDIETLHECHEGPFAGNHARYVLHSQILQGVAHE